MVKLIEPFVDFKPMRRGWSTKPIYKHVKEIKPKKYPFKLTMKKLKQVIKRLQTKYPKHNYRVEKIRLHGETYYRIRRGETGLKNPPIYLLKDPKKRTWRMFVPSSYVNRKKRLVATVIDYRLTALGLK